MARSHGAPLQQAQPAPHKARPAPKDAITLCKADLEAVSQLFAEYGKTRSVPNKKALDAEICTALSVHMQIEEDIFYPALMDVLKDKLLLPEATVELGSRMAARKDELLAQAARIERETS